MDHRDHGTEKLIPLEWPSTCLSSPEDELATALVSHCSAILAQTSLFEELLLRVHSWNPALSCVSKGTNGTERARRPRNRKSDELCFLIKF